MSSERSGFYVLNQLNRIPLLCFVLKRKKNTQNCRNYVYIPTATQCDPAPPGVSKQLFFYYLDLGVQMHHRAAASPNVPYLASSAEVETHKPQYLFSKCKCK